MLPYAESFLEIVKNNQWFVRFFVTPDNLVSVQTMINQKKWFENQGLHLTEVRTHEFNLSATNFYHVNFVGSHDPRLAAYSQQFETEDGTSQDPDHYQMYEWSYSSWIDGGQRERWLSHISAHS